MCECCDDVIKRSVKRSVGHSNIKGKPVGIPIVAVVPGEVCLTGIATSDEQVRTAVEEAGAG